MRSPHPSPAALAGLPSGLDGSIAQLEPLFDDLPDVVFFIKDAEGRYAVVNQTLADRCAHGAKGTLVGKLPREVFPAELGRHYERQDAAVLQSGRVVSRQLELHIYPSGGTGWCLTSKRPLRSADGRICGVAGISRDLDAPSRKSRGYAQLARVLNHMRAHFSEGTRIEDLARLAGLSVYQFEQRIRRLFLMPPLQLLHKLRIEEATRQLRDTALPLSEIAQSIGYCDQSAFTRHFSKFTGITPGKFRALHRIPSEPAPAGRQGM